MDFTTGGRMDITITPADVGKRVSVRRLNDIGAGPEKFTDTVGVLTSWTEGVLHITRRTGETVHIAQTALVAGKVVPAAPARRRGPAASARELDLVAARAWPPVESEPLGEWLLRAAVRDAPKDARPGGGQERAGFTRRANSVLAVGDPGLPLDRALARITEWYAARGLPPLVQLSTGAADTQEALAAELAARGWLCEVSAEVRIAPLAPLADLPADTSRVRLTRDLDDAWLARYQRAAAPGDTVRRVLRCGPSVWFAAVPGPEAGIPLAIGRCAVDGRWAGFTAVEVDPGSRRQGLARAVMAALARQALDEGASAAYLQVETDNGGARALYDGMGFTTHHSYHHWRAPRAGQMPDRTTP
ncbi:GNAT family N-acetyltransferase [Streptomyces palmae]|uniref:GNAT family N-acetyltransferase n=1 Tax=Streptomyces palmae TaxID=1701085 RepID=A0A4Z0H6T2_9ACTN|nr:GNAT family N-acetyltransferase [Streptomyces palmae]TGB08783.1 GNAT family N-acetyltransferase [Streptomyces palmae]